MRHYLKKVAPFSLLIAMSCRLLHIGCGIGDFILQNKSLKLEIDSSGEANKGKERKYPQILKK